MNLNFTLFAPLGKDGVVTSATPSSLRSCIRHIFIIIPSSLSLTNIGNVIIKYNPDINHVHSILYHTILLFNTRFPFLRFCSADIQDGLFFVLAMQEILKNIQVC